MNKDKSVINKSNIRSRVNTVEAIPEEEDLNLIMKTEGNPKHMQIELDSGKKDVRNKNEIVIENKNSKKIFKNSSPKYYMKNNNRNSSPKMNSNKKGNTKIEK